MTDIADMKSEAERGRAFGLAVKQGGCTEMLVPFRPRPHRRQGNEVGEIEGGNRRLADIGIDMARETPEPGFERVHAFDRAGEVAALDDILDEPELLGGERRIAIPYGDPRGYISDTPLARPAPLERQVGIARPLRGAPRH